MMKRSFLLVLLLFLVLSLCGCKGQSSDEYAGETITSLKEGDAASFGLLLASGIEKSKEEFVLPFPDSLKSSYEKLLQTAFRTIEFEVESGQKESDGQYTVRISFTPVDLRQTLEDTNHSILKDPQSADFSEELQSLIRQDTALITDAPAYASKTSYEMPVTAEEKGFSIAEEDLTSFLEAAILNYMDPYNSCCQLYDMQDFLLSYLDASFKGEVAQFALHTDRTEEEAIDWYETDTFDPPEDLDPAYTERYRSALKTIMKNCDYTVGIPRLEDEAFHYQIDVSYVPNTSFFNAFQEFEQGTYYSVSEVSAGLIAALEKYAAAPTYGEASSMTVAINAETVASADQEGTDLYNLVNSIYPLPE